MKKTQYYAKDLEALAAQVAKVKDDYDAMLAEMRKAFNLLQSAYAAGDEQKVKRALDWLATFLG